MAAAVRVLVTGVGGDLGQALVKSLRLNDTVACVGCDRDATGAGAPFVEAFRAVPSADHPGFVAAIEGVCRELRVDAVVPGSEPEMYALAGLGDPLRLPGGVPVVCQPAAWMRTYGDKLTCMDALQGRLELAPYAEGRDARAVATLVRTAGFPLVVKPRRSSGSRNVRRVENETELQQALASITQPFVQAWLEPVDAEFSVGVFAGRAFTAAAIFRRRLGPSGCSWYAETSTDAEVTEYALRFAACARLQGSANLQVRRTAVGVRLLEVNPRFSSLAAARAACGFPDVAWAVETALGRGPVDPPGPLRPLRFQRFYHELLDVGDGFAAAAEWAPRAAAIALQRVP